MRHIAEHDELGRIVRVQFEYSLTTAEDMTGTSASHQRTSARSLRCSGGSSPISRAHRSVWSDTGCLCCIPSCDRTVPGLIVSAHSIDCLHVPIQSVSLFCPRRPIHMTKSPGQAAATWMCCQTTGSSVGLTSRDTIRWVRTWSVTRDAGPYIT